MKKHELPVEIDNLHLLPLHPPRRRFWDCLPTFFREWYLKRQWHNPKPTPREEWIIQSVILRSRFKTYHEAFAALTVAAEAHTIPLSPGSKELN